MGDVSREERVQLNASGWTALAERDTTRVKLLLQNQEAAGGINVLIRFSATDPGASATTGLILHPEATLVDAPACVSAAWGRSASGTPYVWVHEETP